MAITDRNGRVIDYARISVTDRCNYRCIYCMPEEGVTQIPHEQVMRYEEIAFLCCALAQLGVRKIRFTGGEPLVRKGIASFLKRFKGDFPEVAVFVTTNASLLGRFARELSEVPLAGMNISIDTVDAKKFRAITRLGDIDDVRAGIDAARSCGIPNIKTNTVLIRGFNDMELPEILRFAWDNDITPRLIEFMPLGDDVWRREKFIGADEILRMLAAYGEWTPAEKRGTERGDVPSGPAKYYVNRGTGKVVGVIEAVSNHFCASCNRLRITASGNLLACLFSRDEVPLLPLIRSGDLEGLKQAIRDGMDAKPECWEDLRDGKQRMSGIGG